jgi:hypothetical protein
MPRTKGHRATYPWREGQRSGTWTTSEDLSRSSVGVGDALDTIQDITQGDVRSMVPWGRVERLATVVYDDLRSAMRDRPTSVGKGD